MPVQDGLEGTSRKAQPAVIAAACIQERGFVRVKAHDSPYFTHLGSQAAVAGLTAIIVYL